MNDTKTIAIRLTDFQITEANGPRDIAGMIETAKRSIDDRVRTVLCCDGSGNEAYVLVDDEGVTRTYEFRRGGEMDRDEAAALIAAGIDWRMVVEPGEEVPMVAGAKYRLHVSMEFVRWEPIDADTDGYRREDYFDCLEVYAGPDCHGVAPVFCRAS